MWHNNRSTFLNMSRQVLFSHYCTSQSVPLETQPVINRFQNSLCPQTQHAKDFYYEYVRSAFRWLKASAPEALRLGYFRGGVRSFEDVKNRESFLVPIIDQFIRRHDAIKRDSDKIEFDTSEVSPMVTSGHVGIGKTTSIGLLMDILRKINEGGEHKQKVFDYLTKFLPTETIEKFMNAVDGYIAIPIKFDSYQAWRDGEQNEEIAIWSRVLHNILLSSHPIASSLWATWQGCSPSTRWIPTLP